MDNKYYIKPIPGAIRDYDGTYTDLPTALGLTLSERDVSNANDGRHMPMLSTIEIDGKSYSLKDVLTAIKDAIALSDTMTTRGDMLYQAASAPARLAKGTSGYVLTIGANDPAWASADSLAVGDTGDLLTATTLLGQLQELAALIARVVALEGEYLIIESSAIPTTEAALYAGLKMFLTDKGILCAVEVPGEQELDSITFTAGAVTKSGNITIALNSVNKTVAVVGGTAEVRNATITAGATASGNITFTLDGVDKTVAVTASDNAAAVAGKVTAALAADADWTVGNVDAVLTFTSKTKAARAGAFTFTDTGTTGVTCTGGVTQTTPGVDTDSAIAVATKVRATSYTGWTTGGTAGTATVTFLKDAVGACAAPTFTDTDTTGVAASGGFTRTNQGVTTVLDNNPWAAWSPTLTWTTGNPASLTTVARYKVQGKICYFNFMTTSADGNGATALNISLPVAAKDNNSMVTFPAQQLQNASWTNPLAWLDDDANGIVFRAFTTATSGQALTIIVSGQYEIA